MGLLSHGTAAGWQEKILGSGWLAGWLAGFHKVRIKYTGLPRVQPHKDLTSPRLRNGVLIASPRRGRRPAVLGYDEGDARGAGRGVAIRAERDGARPNSRAP